MQFLEFGFSIGCSKTDALARRVNSPPLLSSFPTLLHNTFTVLFHFFMVMFSFVYLIRIDSAMFFHKLIFLKPLSRWDLVCQTVLGKQSVLIIASSFTGAGVRQLSGMGMHSLYTEVATAKCPGEATDIRTALDLRNITLYLQHYMVSPKRLRAKPHLTHFKSPSAYR